MDRIIRIKVDANQAKKEVDVLDDKMTGLGTKINGVAAAIAAAFTTGVVAKFLNDSVNAARNFEESLSNLSAITGAVGKDLEFLRQTALEFGATTTLSASQAAEALKLVASAKPELLESGAALKEVTRQAILLAEAAGIDLASAASTVGNALNQFGAGADQAARFVNVLAAGAKFGSSEIAQTAEALKNAGVAAASAGVTFEQTNAAVQVLAATGVAGAEAGTSLRNIFLKLDTDIDSNLRPSVVGLERALQNLNKQNLTSTQLVEKFGLENIVAGRTLIDNVDNLSKLTGQLTGTNTAFEQASANTDNLNGDLKGLFSALEAVQIQIGSKFTGTLREFTQETTSLLQAVNGNEEALKEWGGSFQLIYNIAVLTASVIGLKLVAATVLAAEKLLINAAAALSAKVQYDAFGLAIGRTTVAANVGAVAMRGLSAVVATLGGPLGVVLLAASALIAFTGAASETKFAVSDLDAEVAKLSESYSKLSAGALGSQYVQAQEEAARVDQQLVEKKKELEQATQKAISGFKSVGSQVTELKENTTKLNAEIAELEKRKSGLAAKIQAVTNAFENGLPSASQYKEELAGTAVAAEETAKNLSLTFDQIKQTSSDLESLFSGGINLFNGSDSASQNDESTNRINERIAALKLETQTLGSELTLQQGIRQGFISQEQAQLDLHTANKIQNAITERDLLLAEKSITKEQEMAAEMAFNENMLAIALTYEEGKTAIAQQEAFARMELDQQVRDANVQSFQSGVSLLQTFLGQSNAIVKAARLAMGAYQAFSIYASSSAAAAAALAPPPLGLGPIKGAPLAGKIALAGKLSAAAVVASAASSTFGGGGGGSFGSGGSGGGSSGALPTKPQSAPSVQTLEIVGLEEIRDELRNQDGMVSTRFVATILDKISDANRIRGEG